ncbi:MAG: D-tyrosyl-tRNA(Tyr) deacylase [Oscillospiraceae bacterium]|nr:D-tyrosyl-tRNA(Tyr) deacylase [Oscillospiraceae bacterium]
MRAVVMRVKNASVEIGGAVHGQIEAGFLILLGIHRDDTMAQAEKIADKICGLRIFKDEAGKINLNPVAANAANLLIISQFTLFADCRSRRPGFTNAAPPEIAVPLYEAVIDLCRQRGFRVETGVFGAEMQVRSQNDGPFTVLLDTSEL